MARKLIGIYGVSGFGREVMPVARDSYAAEDCELVFIDDNYDFDEVNGARALTYQEFLEEEVEEKRVSVAIADAKVRRKIEERCYADGIKPVSIMARNNLILVEVVIGSACILCPFVTLTSNITIGQSFHANIYSYVAHDCVIGDHVTFAPAVKCNGNVVVEDYAYIGTGAVIKQGKPGEPLVVGKGAVVGMGAVVTKSVPPGVTVIGNPAKPI
ncbi:MAG: acetyltransferase [Pseudomonadota bacterium]